MSFRLIAPDELRRVWPAVREGLEKMPPEDWIPEDVYHYIKAGHAALYLYADGSGFVVLRRLVSEFSGEVSCHVWLAYNSQQQEAYDAALALYRDAAKRMGATRITFSSPRKGWAKRFPMIETTYEVTA